MTKKLVSCILVVCMLLSMLPTMAWATEPVVASGSDLDEPVASPTDVTLNIANGPITVEAASGTDNVKYTQGGNTFTVDKDIPVTITGSYSFTSGNAIKITNCSPTIVLKDLTITATGSNCGSNILIDGSATDEVKFILSGPNNTLTRPTDNTGNSSAATRYHCAIQIKNAKLTFACQCENGNCKDEQCQDRLTITAGQSYGSVIGARSGDNIGFTLNFNGGYFDIKANGTDRYGAVIGVPHHSSVVFNAPVAININDGFINVITNESAAAIGGGRKNTDLDAVSVSINGGSTVKAATSGAGHYSDVASVYAGSIEITSGADVTVEGNIVANSVEVTDAKLALEPKDSTTTANPGGSIISNNVTVTSTNGEASLTTVGGINGNLTTSGNVEVEIKGNASTNSKDAPSDAVGGVSGTVTVGAGSKVTVTEEIKGEVTVEGGATINGTTLPEDADTVTVPADKLDDVTVDANGTVTLPADSTITKADGSSVELSEGGTMAADGAITAGGTVTTKDAQGNVVSTVVVPEGKDATVSADGRVTAPAGTTIKQEGKEDVVLDNGGTVDKDGAVTETPVTPPAGGGDDPTPPAGGGDDPTPPAGDGDDPTPPADDEGDKPTPQPPYGGYYPSYTPSVTPAAPSVDSSSLNNAALAVGSAIKDGSAEFTPVNGYTKDEVLQLQKDGKLRLGIEKTVGYGSVAEKNLADAAIKSAGGAVSGTSVMYFDITPVLKLDNGTVVAHVTDTEKAITITIELSDELTKAAKDGKDIAVVRVHDGKAEFLSAKLNAAKTKVTFSSADFSTYAVVALNKATSAKTFDAGVAMYVGMAVLAATGSAVVVGKKRK